MKWLILATVLTGLLAAGFTAMKKAALPGRGEEEVLVVLTVRGHREDVELRVRELVCAARRIRGASIILADFGADGETAEICSRLCGEFANVELIEGAFLENRVREKKSATKIPDQYTD
jgi:hypothetical protein